MDNTDFDWFDEEANEYMKSAEGIDEWIAKGQIEHDNNIRADERAKVIDEIIDLLKTKAWDEDENTWLLFNSVLVPISMVISEIEQLKEKSDELFYNSNEYDFNGECTRNCSAYQQGRADAEKGYQLEYDRQIDNEQEAFENGYEKAE